VYVVSTLAAALEIGELSFTILGTSFPALERLVEDALPATGGLLVVKQRLLDGMWLILAGVLLEKLLSQFIVTQTAVAVAERRAEEDLAISRRSALPTVREEHDLAVELEEFPESLAILSPAARYTLASGVPSGVAWGGFPRVVWSWGLALGLIVEVPFSPSPLARVAEGGVRAVSPMAGAAYQPQPQHQATGQRQQFVYSL